MTTPTACRRPLPIGAALVACLTAVVSLVGCATIAPSAGRADQGHAALPRAEATALADAAELDLDALLVDAAGIDELLGESARQAAAAVPRGELPEVDGTPRQGGTLGRSAAAATVVAGAYTNARAALSVLLVTGFGAAVLGQGTASASPEEVAAGLRFDVVDGRLKGGVSTAADTSVGAVTLGSDLTLSVDVAGCPAADGSVTAVVDVTSRVDATASPAGASTQVWGAFAWRATVTGRVGDDAHLASATVASTSELTSGGAVAVGDVEARGGAFITTGWDFAVGAAGGDLTGVTSDDSPTVSRASRGVTAGTRSEMVRSHADLTYALVQSVADMAEHHWRSGACVDVGIAADADLPVVERGAVVDVTVSPVAASDGAPTGGTVTAEHVGGGGTLTRMAARPSPSSHTYRTPDADDTTTVLFTSTSRRGIGIREQDFRTRPQAYRIDETLNGIRTEGVNCQGAGGEWVITSRGTTDDYQATTYASIHPQTLTGTYSLTGTVDVFAFTGSGIVEIERLADGSMVMHIRAAEAGYAGNGVFPLRDASDLCE